jgi:hypothetical protein
MTGRSAAIQGGLAALGLLAAHLTWQREPERAPGEVVVIDAAKADVGRVRFEDENNILAFQRASTAGGEPTIALHVEAKPKKVMPDKPGDPMPPPTPPETPPRDVFGNADALRLADRFAPLVSPRAFGLMEPAKLKELGLDEPTRSLEVVVRGDTRKYDIGIAMNAQNGESFLRDKRDGRVYLMPRGLLSELQNGKRLVDPRLHLFDSKEFDRITLSVGEKKKEFLHEGRENFSTEGYAPAKTPGKRDQTVKNWHDMLWRTFPMEVLGKDELPKGGTLKPVFRIEYSERGKAVGWLELARLEGTSGKAEEIQDNLFARSEHTVGWTRLHVSPDLADDAQKIIAAP